VPWQELLEQLAYAEECGKLITPPCWTTGDFCTGKLVGRPSAGFVVLSLLDHFFVRGRAQPSLAIDASCCAVSRWFSIP